MILQLVLHITFGKCAIEITTYSKIQTSESFSEWFYLTFFSFNIFPLQMIISA